MTQTSTSKSSTDIDEAVIVRRVSEGDHRAFRQIFDRYKDVLFGYSCRFTKSPPLAEEIVQEVFLKVWQNREKLDPQLSVKSYLYKLTQNLVYNTLRNAAYDNKLKQQIFYRCLNTHYSTEDQVIYRDLEVFKDKAVACLPAKRQLIFRMSRVQGLSHEEIAEQLGISPHTVKDQIVKALKSIKKQLRTHTDIAVSIAVGLLFL